VKPIHAKPQSGRTIEPGLALRIVSKRGRMVVFGQTGLLFANRQWGYVKSTNSNTRIYLPINALPVSVVMNDENTVANDLSISTCSYTSGSFVVYGSRRDGNTVIWGHWVAVCT
jgi:hypothetical protein